MANRLVFLTLCCASLWSCHAAPQEVPTFGEDQLLFGNFDRDWSHSDPEPTWFDVRVDEFLEAFTLRLGLGPGLGARVAFTKVAQAGLMVLGPAEPFGEILHFDTVHFGNAGTQIGAWDVHSVEYGLSIFYSYEEDVFGYFDPSLAWSGAYADRSPAAIEAAVHLGLIGGVAGFDPLAFARFFGGLLGFGEKGWFDSSEDAEGQNEEDESEFDFEPEVSSR